MAKGELRRRKRGESGRGDRHRDNRKRVVMMWSAVLMTAAVGALMMTVWLWLKPKMGGSGEAAMAAAVTAPVRVVSEFESPTEEAALALVRQALRIRLESEVVEYFHPGSSGRAGVIRFLERMEELDGPVGGLEWLSSIDANGLLIDGVVVKTEKDGKLRNRLALLTPDERGIWKIDFDAFARTSEPSWDELLAGNAPHAKVRVIVAEDSYYNGPFRDDRKWACFGMASPDHDKVLLGYCRVGSPQERAMRKVIEIMADALTGAGVNRATLELKRVEGALPRQFEVTRVLAEDWVMAPQAFDEGFK